MKYITCLALILGLFNAEAQTSVRSIGVMGDGKADESAALQKDEGAKGEAEHEQGESNSRNK